MQSPTFSSEHNQRYKDQLKSHPRFHALSNISVYFPRYLHLTVLLPSLMRNA